MAKKLILSVRFTLATSCEFRSKFGVQNITKCKKIETIKNNTIRTPFTHPVKPDANNQMKGPCSLGKLAE